jgi:hypothetical protein
MKSYLTAVLLVLCYSGVSSAAKSHYTHYSIDIEFNGKSDKIIIAYHGIFENDVDLSNFRYEHIPVPTDGKIADALITITPPKGKVKTYTKSNAYQLSSKADFELVSDDRLFFWEFDKLEPDSKIDLFCELKDDHGLGGRRWSVLQKLPIDTMTISFKFSSDEWRLKYSIDNGQPAFTDSSDKVEFCWYNLPAIGKSPYKEAPLDYLPGIDYLFESKKGDKDISKWQDVYLWALDFYGDDQPFEKPADMLSIANTPGAILEAIKKQCHYVAIELGDGAYKPALPGEVWSKGYGDCKGLAYLFVNWMRAAGFQAWPVLVLSNDKKCGKFEFPSPFKFDHMIAAYVDQANDTVYQDLTAEYCPLGYLPKVLCGSMALPLKSGSGPIRLKPFPKEPDTTTIQITGILTNDEILVGKADLTMKGGNAILFNWRGNESRNVDKEQTLKIALEKVLPKATLLQIKSDSLRPDEIRLSSDINIRRFCFKQDSIEVFRPWIFSFIHDDIETDSSLSWPTIFRRNMIYNVSYRVQVADSIDSQKTAMASVNRSSYSFKCSMINSSHDDSLILDFTLFLPPLVLSPDSLAIYKAARKGINRDLDNAVVFRLKNSNK